MSFTEWVRAFEVNVHRDISFGGGGGYLVCSPLGNFDINLSFGTRRLQDRAPTTPMVAPVLQCLWNRPRSILGKSVVLTTILNVYSSGLLY